ncbi:hypothetical protein [Methanococcus voltae]|uniref:Uncharacterized protein n=1 Tax=Methanococcus voltae (strain ATCC BAA-1334 / A3) TaxID=456320 RepID=D7DRB7_METV3|nr:hypothetical protein [Methanococcus voltae]MCS3901054.1 hypothetical protein [Methanococcus voltae]
MDKKLILGGGALLLFALAGKSEKTNEQPASVQYVPYTVPEETTPQPVFNFPEIPEYNAKTYNPPDDESSGVNTKKGTKTSGGNNNNFVDVVNATTGETPGLRYMDTDLHPNTYVVADSAKTSDFINSLSSSVIENSKKSYRAPIVKLESEIQQEQAEAETKKEQKKQEQINETLANFTHRGAGIL